MLFLRFPWSIGNRDSRRDPLASVYIYIYGGIKKCVIKASTIKQNWNVKNMSFLPHNIRQRGPKDSSKRQNQNCHQQSWNENIWMIIYTYSPALLGWENMENWVSKNVLFCKSWLQIAISLASKFLGKPITRMLILKHFLGFLTEHALSPMLCHKGALKMPAVSFCVIWSQSIGVQSIYETLALGLQ